jgi:hypothetical protein
MTCRVLAVVLVLTDTTVRYNTERQYGRVVPRARYKLVVEGRGNRRSELWAYWIRIRGQFGKHMSKSALILKKERRFFAIPPFVTALQRRTLAYTVQNLRQIPNLQGVPIVAFKGPENSLLYPKVHLYQ